MADFFEHIYIINVPNKTEYVIKWPLIFDVSNFPGSDVCSAFIQWVWSFTAVTKACLCRFIEELWSCTSAGFNAASCSRHIWDRQWTLYDHLFFDILQEGALSLQSISNRLWLSQRISFMSLQAIWNIIFMIYCRAVWFFISFGIPNKSAHGCIIPTQMNSIWITLSHLRFHKQQLQPLSIN